jgi:SAM-dependent methyltransferase
MLARAQQRARADRVLNLHLLRGDAQTPILRPGRFDALTSRFGVMFFADPERAFATLGRALRPEGRLIFVCWQPIAMNPWMQLPLAAAAAHLTLPPPPSPVAPGPFAFGDGHRVRQILTAAGFVEIAVEGPEDRLLVAGGSAFDRTVDFVLDLGPLGALLREADQSTRSRVRDAVAEVLKPYASSAGVEMPCAVWIVSARRPGNGVRAAPGSSGPEQRSAVTRGDVG